MALKDHLFDIDELRKYVPSYAYNAFTMNDINEIQNFIQYARGLIIKDDETAQQFESSSSMKSSSTYMDAMDNVLFNKSTDYTYKSIISSYIEENPYYINLYKNYGISYYDARRAKDYDILKATFQTLDVDKIIIFNEAYRESVSYYLGVTYTDAFKNQEYNREVSEMTLIFMTFHRYINKTMNGYFNIDNYDKTKLKNGFISNGLDYFDSLPLSYQRRLLKELNDLISNKGSDRTFEIISKVLSYSGMTINTYDLARTEDLFGKNKLTFYKVPLDRTLDADSDIEIPFETLTANDPFWRASESDAAYAMDRINTVHTKYVSADIVVDLLKNTRQMSYFMGLVNSLQIKNKKAIEAYMETYNAIYQDSVDVASIESVDFSFNNKNISDSPINIYNALIALYNLVLKKMNWSNNIHRINYIKDTYAYNLESDSHDILVEARGFLYQNETELPEAVYTELMNFFSEFNVKGFSLPVNVDFSNVQKLYKSNAFYQSQTIIIAELLQGLISSDKMVEHIKSGNLYDGLEFLTNTMLDPKRHVPYSFLMDYTYFKELLSNFVELSVSTGYVSLDRIYTYMLTDDNILGDLDTYIKFLNDFVLNEAYSRYLSNKSVSTMMDVISQLDRVIKTQIEEGTYLNKASLDFYPNLSVFLNCFLGYRSVLNDVVYTMEDFTQIFIHNEETRTQLETYIQTSPYPQLVTIMNKLWETKFKSDYSMELFKGYYTYDQYLQAEDPNLYYYTNVEVTVQNADSIDLETIYRDKIFELVEGINNQSYLGQNYDFLVQNNFIGLGEYIKEFAYILLKVFKAYTVDTVYTADNYTFYDYIHITDRLEMSSSGVVMFKDYIDTQDTVIENDTMTGDVVDLELKEAVTLITHHADGTSETVTIK